MISLKTKYVGLDLETPIIVSSAGITETVERMRRCEENGAGAVVMKSLFENEISRTSPTPRFKIIKHNMGSYKTFTLFSYEQASEWGPDRYAEEVTNAKAKLKIKIIPSINCSTEAGWVSYARKMEEAGADALEINVSCPHSSITFTGKEVEKEILTAAQHVREAVSIPVIAKLSPQLTSPLSMVHALKDIGINGVTIFNRITGLDIDIEAEQPIMHRGYAGHGGPWAIMYPLRWISAIAPQVNIDISASGGVSSADDVIKYLLAGATTVQVCTAVYMNGYEIVQELVKGLTQFMERKGYQCIDDFRGKVCSRILGTTEIERRHVVVAQINKKIAPCKAACPIDQSAQAYVSLIAEGRFEEALKLVKQENPLPAICGRVCHHPCEAECTRGLIDQPLSIAALKRFLADYEMRMGVSQIQSVKLDKEDKIAVVGSGPAGLSAAYFLTQRGYPVTIFEAASMLGGMLKMSIPAYRLPKDIVDKEIDSILNLGIEVKKGVRIGRDLSLDALRKDGFKAIFLAIGAHKSQKLGVPGEDAEGVLDGLEFLRSINLGQDVKIGQRVAVIGGGDTAIDSVRSAIRLGAKEVYLVYRRTKDEMPARAEEVREAEEEGVRILYLVAPVEISAPNGKVESIRCVNLYLAQPDGSRRRKPVVVEGTEFSLKVDTVISAIGQVPDLAELVKDSDLKITGKGLLHVDADTLMTNIEGVFAGGDVVTGPATVVEAIGAGKRVAEKIDLYLQGKEMKIPEESPLVVDKKEVWRRFNDVQELDRQGLRFIPLSERRTSFKEVTIGYTEDEALREAKRCLACGCAIGCGICKKVCIYFAIDQTGDGFQVDPEKCDGCGFCVERCPNECISMIKRP
ncbi:MAG: hypothetical protein B1H12_08565 [Desulfobacteraceae bacterium 4484_190.2]|nr:MAG: hypothetical protein B1H12_08565 [Desulfobacteraceae bacterium 4484_190.2]